MVRLFIIFILITSWANCFPQEKQVSVPFSQPHKLTGNAGNDVEIYQDVVYSLGNHIEQEGGTPEFTYMWETPAGDTVFNPVFDTVNITGTFYLTVTDANNCTLFDSLAVSFATGLHKPDYRLSHFYPNPANEYLHYRIATLNGPAEVTIINARGDVIVRNVVSGSTGFAEGVLDIRNIPPGSYIVYVRTAVIEYSEKVVIKR